MSEELAENNDFLEMKDNIAVFHSKISEFNDFKKQVGTDIAVLHSNIQKLGELYTAVAQVVNEISDKINSLDTNKSTTTLPWQKIK